MAEERTLGLARAREIGEEELSKEELQRRMDEARDSITNTVTEIKENVTHQYESVKDALDWREHVKKRPVAWSLGAAGVGFFVGYGIAAALSEDDHARSDNARPDYAAAIPRPYAAQRDLNPSPSKTNAKEDGPGMLERFKGTSAYDHLSKEAGALGDRVIEELSSTAQLVVLPFLLKKVKNWIGLDLSEKSTSMGAPANRSVSHESSIERSRES